MKRTNRIVAVFFLMIAGFYAMVSASAGEAWEAQARKADHSYWAAYNRQDSKTMNSYLADDVEFYHDMGGPTIGKKMLAAMNDGMMASKGKVRREEVPGTVHFYPMRKDGEIYGALVQGEHRFFVTPDGKPEFLAGSANYMHLMLYKDGKWKIARIFSYQHAFANTEKK